jgi:hypothetical protein
MTHTLKDPKGERNIEIDSGVGKDQLTCHDFDHADDYYYHYSVLRKIITCGKLNSFRHARNRGQFKTSPRHDVESALSRSRDTSLEFSHNYQNVICP